MREKKRNPHPSRKPASSQTKPLFRRSEGPRAPLRTVEGTTKRPFRMFLIPCSCGITFAVAENDDRLGTARSLYMICPGCAKRHDPKNRLLQMGFHPEGYWKVDDC